MAGDLIFSCKGKLITSVGELNAVLAEKTDKKTISIRVLRYQRVDAEAEGWAGKFFDAFEYGWAACRASIKSGPLKFKVENNAD